MNAFFQIRFFLFFILVLFGSKGEAQKFEWSAKAQYTVMTGGTYCKTDSAGNIYVTGYYHPCYEHGCPTEPYGCFLSKYDKNGSLIWNNFLNKSYDSRIALSDNTIYLSGRDTTGCYVKKYSLNGLLLNTFIIIPNGACEQKTISDIEVDNLNNYFISGVFYNGTVTLGEKVYKNTGPSDDFFIAKVNLNDSCIWSTGTSQGNFMSYPVIDLNIDGSLLLGGAYTKVLSLNGDTIRCSSEVNDHPINGFVAKFDASGNILRLQNIGNSVVNSGRQVQDIRQEKDGHFYVTGQFQEDFAIADTFITTQSINIYLLKYDPDGNPLWVRKIGGGSLDFVSGISLSSNGIFLSATYESSTQIGSDNVYSSSYSNGMQQYESYIVSFDKNGQIIWYTQTWCLAGSNGTCGGIVASGESVVVTGEFNGMMDFGGHPLASLGESMFLTKINSGPNGITQLQSPVEEFKIFPNPGSLFKVSCNLNRICSFEITILDMNGRTIFSEVRKSFSGEYLREFNLSNFPEGVYEIEIYTDHLLASKQQISK